MIDELKNLTDKKILILGFGREGVSTYRFLRKYFPTKELIIADQKESDKLELPDDGKIKYYGGKGYLDKLLQFDVIFKSPGIPNKLPEIKEARKKGVEFSSQTKLFFDLCKGTIIGVTGTKGKSTTTSLIYEILKSAKYPAVILGNIGKPCLDYLDEKYGYGKYFVFELSSHQLSDLTKSPHIGVFLNIFREHLDYYESFEDYYNAKANITRFQDVSDYFIYDDDSNLVKKATKLSASKKLSFSISDSKSDCFTRNNAIYYKGEEIIKTREINLLGSHNLNNVMAAILVGKCLNVKTDKIRKAISHFKPLSTRLNIVGTFKGITFVDDSLATIPEATIAAINSFPGKVGSLILGGSDRGQDFSELAKVVVKEKVDALALFPTTGDRILSEIKKIAKTGKIPVTSMVDNMKDAVEFCFKNTPKDKVCLQSCASPSFSIFKDYEDKSRQFRKCVRYFAKTG